MFDAMDQESADRELILYNLGKEDAKQGKKQFLPVLEDQRIYNEGFNEINTL